MDNISKLVFKFNDQRYKNTFEVIATKVNDKFNIITDSFNIIYINNYYEDLDVFISKLKDIHIENWKTKYEVEPGCCVYDGYNWSLEVFYSNNAKATICSGFNEYPSNFNKLLELFNIDSNKLF